ncbi:MAG: hypothetical protein ACOY30_05280 [Bacillota bacterium]
MDAATAEFLDHRGKIIDVKAYKQFENIPQTTGDLNPPAGRILPAILQTPG